MDIWSHQILVDGLSFEEAKAKEIEMIAKFDTFKNGYNSTIGGEGLNGFKQSQKTKDKLRNLYLGKKRSEETRNKISKGHKGQIPWTKGKHLTEEHKQNISQSSKGKHSITFTEEHKKKIAESHRGMKRKPFSKEHLANMRLAQQRRHAK